MDYLISELRIHIPTPLVTRHFQQALEPFVVNEKSDKTSDLLLTSETCATAGADYCELDRFDFSDADADCHFGHDSEGYLLEMTPRGGAATARFRATFHSAAVSTNYLPTEHHPALLRFGLWTTLNLVALAHHTLALHASANVYCDQAVLFLGESGTGKSTHTRLWREHISGVTLLNDDSPLINLRHGQPLVSGSPWSGKTPCYINRTYPIRAIVRLSQAPHNHICRLHTIEAIGALLPSCPPAFARDNQLQDTICEVISRLIAQVPIYHLECLPNAEAAHLAHATIFGESTLSKGKDDRTE